MEINENDLKIWKQKLLRILDFFVMTCEQNNIKYYCCGGTALGAVRHGGYIPWDDDIDVIMPRADYDKFEQLMNNMNYDEFEMISVYKNSNYYYPFNKLCLKQTSLIELDNQPYVEGLYLDIFPIDGCSENLSEFSKMLKSYRILSWKLEAKSVPFQFSSILTYLKRKYYSILKPLPFYFIKSLLNRKKIIGDLNKISLRYSYDSSDYVVVYSGSYGKKERIKKEWLGNGIIVDFENIRVRIPTNFDAYLSHIYGDYMKMPPKEKQVGHHFAYYYNLSERLSLEEIHSLVNK